MQDRPEYRLVDEIMRKEEIVNYELLDLASGGHLSMFHVGMSDEELVRRQFQEHGKCCSTFKDKNAINIALSELFEDRYACQMISKWVLDASATPRKSFDGFSNNKLGRKIKKNGAIVECEAFVFVLQKQTSDYRNIITGLPFDIVTIYVEE